MPTLKKLLKHTLNFFASIGKGIIVAIVVGLVGVSVLISYVTNTLNYIIQSIKLPTPLWATIVLVILCFGYIYLRTSKSHSSRPPNYKIKYLTIGNHKWETKIYKDGYFEVEKYPLCIKHDLRFIFGNHEKHCPAPNCNNRISEYDEFKIYESAKSIIENKVRNKDY